MDAPAQKLFCWRCHGHQRVEMEGAKGTVTFPGCCLDVAACQKDWDDGIARATEAARRPICLHTGGPCDQGCNEDSACIGVNPGPK